MTWTRRSRGKPGAVRTVDTNILVRFLVADDPRQAGAARKLIADGDVFIPTTVVLQTEWVLRAGYEFSPTEIGTGLRSLGGLPGVTFEDPVEVSQALDWLGAGLDFADALHLTKSVGCTAFVTFDRKLAKRAKAAGALPVEVV